MMPQQLTLPVQLRDDVTFASFYPGANQNLVEYLQSFVLTPHDFCAYLWGQPGVGCSHLLQACCQLAHEQGLRSIYFPLAQLQELSIDFFNNLEVCNFVCIDNVEIVAGKPAWEEALFHFYNRLQMAKSHLLVATTKPPACLGIQLPDLLSRLMNSITFQVHSLNDENKLNALQLRAKLRGLELSDEVGNFLLTHYSRDPIVLFNLLEKLDNASLAAQRRLTIPFIKAIVAQ